MMQWLLALFVACSFILTALWLWSPPTYSTTQVETEATWISPGNATLVIVNGQIRGGILCWKSFKRHILDHYQADLALVKPYERENDEVVHWEMQARYVLKIKEHEDWAPEFTRINRGNTSWGILRQQPVEIWQFLGGVKGQQGSAGILLAYRFYARMFLRSILEVEPYQWVIYVRSDYVYLCSPPSVISLNPRKIYVPECEHYGGVSDRFTIMTSEKADIYLGITEDLLAHGKFWREYLKEFCGGNANLECLIKVYLHRQGQEVAFFSPVSFTVRRDTDPTRWSAGIESDIGKPHGFLLKYPSEYRSAEETCKPIIGMSTNVTEYLSEMLHWGS